MVEACTYSQDGSTDYKGEVGAFDSGTEQIQWGDDVHGTDDGTDHDQQHGHESHHGFGGGLRTQIGGTPAKRVGNATEDGQGDRHDGEGGHDRQRLFTDRCTRRVEEGLSEGAEGQEAEGRGGNQQDVTIGLGDPGGPRQDVQGDADDRQGQNIDRRMGEHPRELLPDGVLGTEPEGRATPEVDVGQHRVGGQYRQHPRPDRGGNQRGPGGERKVPKARTGDPTGNDGGHHTDRGQQQAPDDQKQAHEGQGGGLSLAGPTRGAETAVDEESGNGNDGADQPSPAGQRGGPGK